ncbi:MAG TPA: hypothetical protein VF916_11840 [Ktedonobacterales bacterium]
MWVIDHKTRSADVWNAQGRTTLGEDQALTSALLPGFSVAVRFLFDS